MTSWRLPALRSIATGLLLVITLAYTGFSAGAESDRGQMDPEKESNATAAEAADKPTSKEEESASEAGFDAVNAMASDTEAQPEVLDEGCAPPASAVLSDPSDVPTDFMIRADNLGVSSSAPDFSLPRESKDNQGAYSFSIPIELPEGGGGLTPTVALTYSTNGPGNGDLGVGWNLQATSSIERKGGQKTGPDGEPRYYGGVPQYWDLGEDYHFVSEGYDYYDQGGEGCDVQLNRNTSDVFYMDGVRLVPSRDGMVNCPEGIYVPVNGYDRAKPILGPNGPINTVYPYDNDFYNGWRVAKPNGDVWIYDFYVDVATRGGLGTYGLGHSHFASTYKWHLSEIESQNSNVFFHYSQDCYDYTGTRNRLLSILYGAPRPLEGGQPGFDPHDWEVVFEWEERPDPSTSYEKCVEVQNTHRLKSIEIRREDNDLRLRKYYIDYTVSRATGASLVSAVRITGVTDNDTLPSYQFDYHDEPNTGWTMESPSGLTEENQLADHDKWRTKPTGVVTADINKDGYIDLLRSYYSDPETYEPKVWLGSEDLTWTYSPEYSTRIGYLPPFDANVTELSDNGDLWWHPDLDGKDLKATWHFNGQVRLLDLNRDGHLDAVRSLDEFKNHVTGTDYLAEDEFTDHMSWIWQEDDGEGGEFVPESALPLTSYGNSLDELDGSFDYPVDRGWMPNRSFYLIGNLPERSHKRTDGGVALMDLNLDGLPDLLRHGFNRISGYHEGDSNVLLNDGERFNLPYTGLNCSNDFYRQSYNPYIPNSQGFWYRCDHTVDVFRNTVGNHGVGFPDLNGDGLPDAVVMKIDKELHDRIYTTDGIWDPPEQIEYWEPDVHTYEAYINEGRSWEYSEEWTTALQTLSDAGIALTENNLVYKVRCYGGGNDPTCYGGPEEGPPNVVADDRVSHGTGVRFIDVNGDGRDDVVQALRKNEAGPGEVGTYCPDPWTVPEELFFATYINTGTGFELDPDWVLPKPLTVEWRGVRKVSYYYEDCNFHWQSLGRSADNGVRLLDLDSDGRLDILSHGPDGEPTVYRSNILPHRDKLKRVINPTGGRTRLTYTQVGNDADHPDLGNTVTVVDSICVYNGIGGDAAWESWTKMHYFGGGLAEGRFSGFRAVSAENPYSDSLEDERVYSTKWYIVDEEHYTRLGRSDFSMISAHLETGSSSVFDGPGLGPDVSDILGLEIESTTETIWSCDWTGDRVGPYNDRPDIQISRQYDVGTGICMSTKQVSQFDDFGNTTVSEIYSPAESTVPYRRSTMTYCDPYLDNVDFVQPAGFDPYYAPSIRMRTDALAASAVYDGASGILKLLDVYYRDNGTVPSDPIDGPGLVTRIVHYGWSEIWDANASSEESFEYNDFGNLTHSVDASGAITTYHWDSEFEQLYPRATVNAVGQETEYGYDDYGNITTVTDVNQNVRTLQYDGLHRVEGDYLTDAAGTTLDLPSTSVEFFQLGNPENQYIEETTKVSETATRRSRTFFDGLGRTYVTEQPDASAGNVRVAHRYDLNGQLKASTLPYIGTDISTEYGTTIEFDRLGRQASMRNPGNYLTTFGYGFIADTDGGILSVTDVQVHRGDVVLRKKIHADAFGRMKKIVEYDDVDGVETQYTTAYTYDVMDNRTGVCLSDGDGDWEHPDASRNRYFFDGFGRLIVAKDANMTNCVDSDIDNHQTGCPIVYEYDEMGRIVLAKDSRHAAGGSDASSVVFEYDDIGRMTQKRVHYGPGDPVEGQWDEIYYYSYDLAMTGYPFAQTNTGGRLSQEEFIRNGATDAEVCKRYSYDAAGRIIGKYVQITLPEQPSESATMIYRYNSDGAVREVDVQRDGDSLETLEYLFHADGSVREMRSSLPDGAILASDILYNEAGQLVSMELGNGSQLSYDYRDGDPTTPAGDRNLDTITATYNSGGGTFMLQYDYDAAGNIVEVYDSFEGPLAYQYDRLNRLTAFSRNGGLQETFTYNRLGNRVAYSWLPPVNPPDPPDDPELPLKSSGGSIITPETSVLQPVRAGGQRHEHRYSVFGSAYSGQCGPHALHYWTDVEGGSLATATALFEYDANGNMVLFDDLESGRERQFEYNYDNKLVRTVDGARTVRHFYGSSSEKIAVNDNGKYKYYLDPLVEVDDGELSLNLKAGNTLLGRYRASTGIRFHVADHLGSVRLELNNQARITKSTIYKPYGEIENRDVDSYGERHTFNGNPMDSSGILDYKARHYAPMLGIFLQADRVVPDYSNPQGLNPYSYVLNNPLNLIDPSGHFWKEAGEFMSGVGSGFAGGAKGTWSFATHDAWQGETWAASGNLVLGAVTTPFTVGDTDRAGIDAWIAEKTGGMVRPNTQEAVDGLVTSVGEGYKAIRSGNPHRKGEIVGEILWGTVEGAVAGAALGAVAVKGVQILSKVDDVGRVAQVAKEAGQLSKQARKGIRSLQKQIASHEQKIADFKANPTVRPGMEKLSKELIKKQQLERIRHWEKEIQTFKDNIEKIRRGEL